jgi:hypothetical protein
MNSNSRQTFTRSRSANVSGGGDRFDELIQLMRRMEHLHDDMTRLIREKLECIRQGKMDAVADVDRRSESIAQSISQQNAARLALMERVGKSIGVDADAARTMSVLRLAERVTDPIRTRLLGAAYSLKKAILETRRANAIAQNVTQEVLGHLKFVFDAFTGAAAPSGAYTNSGRNAAPARKELFEVIG